MKDPAILFGVVGFYVVCLLFYGCAKEIRHERRFPWVTIRFSLAIAISCIFAYWILGDLLGF